MYREDDGQTGCLHHNSAAGGFGWQAGIPKAFRQLQPNARSLFKLFQLGLYL